MPENAWFVLSPSETGEDEAAARVRLRRLLDGSFPRADIAVQTEAKLRWFPSHVTFHCRCERPETGKARAAGAPGDEVILWIRPRRASCSLHLNIRRQGGCTISASSVEAAAPAVPLAATWKESNRFWSAAVDLPFALLSTLLSVETAPDIGEVWQGNLLRHLQLPEGRISYAWRPDYGTGSPPLEAAGNLIFLAPELLA
ncbi:MAG: hypothetical protein Kow00109_01340 [Acidobacteriota bacterium]